MKMENLSAIRNFLMEFFDDNELRLLAADYFRDVFNDFTNGMSKSQKAQLLVEHCYRNGRIPELLAALGRERERPFHQYFPNHRPETQIEAPIYQRNPHQIFVSYAHQDFDLADHIAKSLSELGWNIWIAPQSIRPGEKWIDAINRGLRKSRIFLLVLTGAAFDSKWVRSETNVAIEFEHKNEMNFVILMVEQVDVPPLWRNYQWIEFNDNYIDVLSRTFNSFQHETPLETTKSLVRDVRGYQNEIPSKEIKPISSYSSYKDEDITKDGNELGKDHVEQLKEMYAKLNSAYKYEKWREVLNLGQQIQEINLNYSNTVKKMHHARKQLLILQKQSTLSPESTRNLSFLAFMFTVAFLGLIFSWSNDYGLFTIPFSLFFFLVTVLSASIFLAWAIENYSRININKASFDYLLNTLGLSESSANTIIDYRKTQNYFLSLRELKELGNFDEQTEILINSKLKAGNFVEFKIDKISRDLFSDTQRIIKKITVYLLEQIRVE